MLAVIRAADGGLVGRVGFRRREAGAEETISNAESSRSKLRLLLRPRPHLPSWLSRAR